MTEDLRPVYARLINLAAEILKQRHWGDKINARDALRQDDALANLGYEARQIADLLATPAPAKDLRAEFEAWAVSEESWCAGIERHDDSYKAVVTAASWVAWQAGIRSAATSAPAQPEGVVDHGITTNPVVAHETPNTLHKPAGAAAPAEGAASLTQLQRAHEAGFRTAANWMERDDLIADVDSPAYAKDRDQDLAEVLAAAPKEKP